MKRTVLVIMAMCAIGLSGCSSIDASTRQVAHNNGSGDIKQDQVVKDNTNSANTSLTGNTAQLTPLPLAGWYAWPRNANILTTEASGNECIISSRGRLAEAEGIVNEHFGTALRGKKLVLYFSNTRASDFHEGRMVKVEFDNRVIRPENAFPIDGYLPAGDTPLDNGIEYIIPNTFDGKLNFTFYRAELNGLKITAFYK